MPADPKKKEKDLLAKAECYRADETFLHEYAALADQLGFASRETRDSRERSSDREIARNALLKARKLERYKYSWSDVHQFVELTKAIVAMETVSNAFRSDLRFQYNSSYSSG